MRQVLLSILLFLTSTLMALPIGNPIDPTYFTCSWLLNLKGCCPLDRASVRVGYYGDFVFNRNLEVAALGDIEDAELFTNAGIVVLNLCNRIDLYATFGVSDFLIDTDLYPFADIPSEALQGSRFILETSTDFSWSIGARANVIECCCFYLTGGFQYFRYNPHVQDIKPLARFNTMPGPEVKLDYSEWQVDFAVGYRIYRIAPYMGISYAKAFADLTDIGRIQNQGGPGIILRDMCSEKPWSYCVGATLLNCDRASLTVEGRFAGEKAVHVNGQLRF